MNVDAPTLGELYLKAAAGNRLSPDSGTLNLIAAAGMVRDNLGLTLLRLRGEFDRARSTMPNDALRVMADRLAELRALEAKAWRKAGSGPTDAARIRAERDEFMAQMNRLIRASWMSASTRMPTMPAAAAAVARFAERMASQQAEPPAHPDWLASDALHWWIDPSCPACGGVGSIGPHGGVRLRCTVCRGRCYRELPNSRGIERDFCALLVSELDRKVSIALSQLSRTYRGR